MRNNLDSYRAYSAGKLEIVRNKIDKDLEKVEQNIENLEDKKNNTLEKISQIENTIESKIEKKIGKNPSKAWPASKPPPGESCSCPMK